MRWADTVDLISAELTQDAEGNQRESERSATAFCNRYAFGASSYMAAKAAGLHADARIQLRTCDYAGQQKAVFDGTEYDIEDVSQNGDVTLLTLARRASNDGV